MNDKAISEKKDGGGCVLGGVGLVFFLAGAFFFWMVFLSPLVQSLGSGSWPQADCKILKSELEISRDTDGTSYKPIVEYSYIVDGIEYSGDSPTFENISARKKWAKGIVDKYEVGATSKCFYNPKSPETSVLDRNFLWSFYAMAFVPLIFIVPGLAFLGSAIFGWGSGEPKPPKTVSGHVRSRASSRTKPSTTSNLHADGMHAGDIADQEWSIPKRLARKQGRWVGLIVITVFAIFWNSFVGFFIFSDFKNGPDLFMLLFMIPFVLVGLLLLIGILYAAMAMFNPEVEVALSTGAIAPGESVDIAWEVKGKANKFKTLKILLCGIQTATYRDGTDLYTEKEFFEQISILHTNQTEEMEFGSATVTIPAETMHTFEAKNNNIKWEVMVLGDIPWWPDVNESFEFRVKPT